MAGTYRHAAYDRLSSDAVGATAKTLWQRTTLVIVATLDSPAAREFALRVQSTNLRLKEGVR